MKTPTPAAVDVSPEAIAALVAAGTQLVSAPSADEHEADQLRDSEAVALLVGLTHDLRSPLGSMLMLLERLRAGAAGPLTPLQERQLGLVYSAAFGAAALTNDAFDLARGRQTLVATPAAAFDLGDVLRQVQGLVQPIAEEKGLRLLVSCAVRGRRTGNAAIVQRVLLNLVTNALKYTASGVVTVEAVEPEADLVHFTVSDTGGGLPPAVHRALDQRVDGTGRADEQLFSSGGLGVALCVALLRHCGSTLHYSAVEPTGSRLSFALSLPAAPLGG